MHAPRKEPGSRLPIIPGELDVDARCPGCGEYQMIEWDVPLRRWVCNVCDWQWRDDAQSTTTSVARVECVLGDPGCHVRVAARTIGHGEARRFIRWRRQSAALCHCLCRWCIGGWGLALVAFGAQESEWMSLPGAGATLEVEVHAPPVTHSITVDRVTTWLGPPAVMGNGNEESHQKEPRKSASRLAAAQLDGFCCCAFQGHQLDGTIGTCVGACKAGSAFCCW
jgi:hypothetical protein